MSESMVEKVARAIAIGMGDDFDHAFTGKAEWNAERGEKGGRYRDINEPYQGDYLDAARAAIEAMREPTEEMRKALSVAFEAEDVKTYRAMITAALSNTEAREQ